MGAKWTRAQLFNSDAVDKVETGQQTMLPVLSRKEKMQISRAKTNRLTREVIDYLNSTNEFVVWRNNNIPSTRLAQEKKWMQGVDKYGQTHFVEVEIPVLKHKKSQITVRTLDIIGYRISDGKHLEIEVKTGNDRLSEGQDEHIRKMVKAGAISFAFKDRPMFDILIKPFLKTRVLPF